jgi:hypothetical protein
MDEDQQYVRATLELTLPKDYPSVQILGPGS